jgi:2-polyprenyl-6-methoxyphenol hydroxylase-like FAD-dependent oxidoreductase
VTTVETEVLIVGGGPVGLALAVELGQAGISVLLAEADTRGSNQPRAKTTHVRSMEFFRRWGLAEAVRAAAPLPPDYPSDIVFRTRFYGPDITTIHNAFNATEKGRNPLYSERGQWVPQYKIEQVLRETASTLPSVDLRFGTRLEQIGQDAKGVTAELSDGVRVRAQYAVGADGARSTTRAAIGVKMSGRGAYALNFNIIARLPGMDAELRREPAIMYWLVNKDAPCFTGPMDVDDTWFFGCVAKPGQTSLSSDEALALMTTAFGRKIDAEILQIDLWNAMGLTADKYREGRILLAGDACQLRPPFGGYGMNLGLWDAMDAGWKLIALLRGWGGTHLLDSYEAERRPVHQRFVAEGIHNYELVSQNLVRDKMEDDGEAGAAVRAELAADIQRVKPREFHTLGIVKGYHYENSPIIVPDGTPAPEDTVETLIPTARPGHIAPHLWLEDGSSLYDHFGKGFTLLVSEGGADAADFTAAAKTIGMPLTIAAPNDKRLPALYGARYALIRPDQHIAWRGDAFADDVLDRVRGA